MKVWLPTAIWKPCLALLQAFILFQAAGCEPGQLVSSAVETHVKADSGVERRVLLDAKPPGPKLTLTRAWTVRKGVNTRGRSVSRTTTLDTPSGKERAGISLDVKDRGLWREYAFTDRPGGLLEAGRGISGEIGYKLVMPGRITEGPGAARRSGSVAVYRFERDEKVDVKAESWAVRWWAVAAVVVLAVLIGALVLGGRARGIVRDAGRWLWTGRVRREDGG